MSVFGEMQFTAALCTLLHCIKVEPGNFMDTILEVADHPQNYYTLYLYKML